MSCFGDFERHLFQVFVGDYIPLLLGDVKNEDIYQPPDEYRIKMN